jgi:hypothetical protein
MKWDAQRFRCIGWLGATGDMTIRRRSFLSGVDGDQPTWASASYLHHDALIFDQDEMRHARRLGVEAAGG